MAGSGLIKRLNDYIKETTSLFDVRHVIMFGSFAADRQKVDSDIDIAFFIDKIDDADRLHIMTKLLVLSAKYKLDIQPLVFPASDFYVTDNDFIQNEIVSKGKRLYKAA